jgi:hypothetical protein
MTNQEFAERWTNVTGGHYRKDKVHSSELARLGEITGILAPLVSLATYHAEHDILFLGFFSEDTAPDNIPDTTLIRLAELGVHVSTEYEPGLLMFAAFC